MKRPPRRPARGFSLVEVMVSLIIIAVGMLGLAKIQALAYSSTGVASQESIAALEAASLGAAMRADRNYWASVTTPFSFTSTGLTLASPTDSTLTGTYPCAYAGTTPACPTANEVAAFDLQDWVTNLNTVLPTPTASVTCPTPAANQQLGCWIQITWMEETVAVNSTGSGAPLPPPTYTLYVVP